MSEESMAVACEACGLCCRHAAADYLRLFGLPVHERGEGCAHQADDGACRVYDMRPDVCRVDKMFLALAGRIGMCWGEYEDMSRKVCADLQRRHGYKPGGNR